MITLTNNIITFPDLIIIDIDECEDSSMNDCVPEATCLNTAGNFVCMCPPSRDDTNGREGEGCVGEINVVVILSL